MLKQIHQQILYADWIITKKMRLKHILEMPLAKYSQMNVIFPEYAVLKKCFCNSILLLQEC